MLGLGMSDEQSFKKKWGGKMPLSLEIVLEIALKSGHFSLNYDNDNDEWDASFFDADTESGCWYGKTIEEAITGAIVEWENRNKANK